MKNVTFKGNANGTLEQGATTIGDYAFTPYIATVNTTVNNITVKIGDIVTELKSLTFEPGVNVEKIGDHAFEKQVKLFDIDYGKDARINEIGAYAFAENILLKEVNIPSTTTKIGEYAYAGCELVEQVTLVEGAANICFLLVD